MIEKFVAQVKAQISAHEQLSKTLSVDLEDGRIVFSQPPESTKMDIRDSLFFGIVWAIIIPVALYDNRETLPYVWIFSVCLSLWWCYDVFIKKSLHVGRIIYFDIDVAQKAIRIPRPAPYHITSYEVVDIRQVEQFSVDGSGDEPCSLVALINSKKVVILRGHHLNKNDLAKIAQWLTSLSGVMG